MAIVNKSPLYKIPGYCIFFLLMLALVGIGCNNGQPLKDFPAGQSGIIPPQGDTAQVQENIEDFLRWYKKNLKQATSFPILARDSAGRYRVDSLAYTAYLNFMLSSRLISPQYVGYWQTFFRDKQTLLLTDTITTSIPEDFDFDFVLFTQKPEEVLNKIDSLHFNIMSMSDSAALVGITLPANDSLAYEFEMYKGKNGWQIGYISTPNYD